MFMCVGECVVISNSQTSVMSPSEGSQHCRRCPCNYPLASQTTLPTPQTLHITPTMTRLTRKASAIQLLSLNAEQAQTEQQALHAEVNSLKEVLKRSHTAYTMLRDDVERFKGIVRAQDGALKRLGEQVADMRREIAALRRPPVPEMDVVPMKPVVPSKPIRPAESAGRSVRDHIRRR